eukprot:Awhi_evm1s13759
MKLFAVTSILALVVSKSQAFSFGQFKGMFDLASHLEDATDSNEYPLKVCYYDGKSCTENQRCFTITSPKECANYGYKGYPVQQVKYIHNQHKFQVIGFKDYKACEEELPLYMTNQRYIYAQVNECGYFPYDNESVKIERA